MIFIDMKKQLNEVQKLQKIAGILKEDSQYTQSENTKFKDGDRITIGTGYDCDKGIFKKYEGNFVIWKSVCGGEYKTPMDKYKITKINES